jgi:hypothetical protein
MWRKDSKKYEVEAILWKSFLKFNATDFVYNLCL